MVWFFLCLVVCLTLFVFFTLLALVMLFHLITLEQNSGENSGSSGGELAIGNQVRHEESASGAGNQFIFCAKPFGQDGKGQQAVIAPLSQTLVAALSTISDTEMVVFVQNLPSLTAGRKARGVIYAVPGWLEQVMQWPDVMTTTFVLYGKGSDLYQVCSAVLLCMQVTCIKPSYSDEDRSPCAAAAAQVQGHPCSHGVDGHSGLGPNWEGSAGSDSFCGCAAFCSNCGHCFGLQRAVEHPQPPHLHCIYLPQWWPQLWQQHAHLWHNTDLQLPAAC